MNAEYRDKLINYLSQFLLERRSELFEKILNDRTRYMTVVLEDIFQSQNASAILRSSDCFGLQDLHIIENQFNYKINPDVAMGSDKWLNISYYDKEANNTRTAIKKLKSEGYRIIATTPHKDDVDLEEFDIDAGKFALVFGSEKPGISDTVLEEADEYLKIPMYGFTESFNVSVSAAICLHHLRWKLENSNIDWKLSEEEKQDLRLKYILNTVKKPKLLVKEFERLHPELITISE